MERINELAKVELEPEQVFVFPDKLAGDMVIPDRYMQIHKSLLNVFKENAIAGVSMLLDHSWAGFFARPKPAIPYGRTFDAKVKKSDIEGEEWALFADHYIVRGKEIDGISTDSIIASIEDGTFFDSSIGWGASNYTCSICGNYYTDYGKCQHYIGQEYEEGICYAIAKPPGGLYENSLVWDGAYPGAGVLSVTGDAENNSMTVIDDLKGLTPGISLFHTFSAGKGKLLTFAKKDDMPKKVILTGADLKNSLLKGGGSMEKGTLEFIKTFGIDYKEGETKLEETLKQIAEKWDASIQTIKDNAATSQNDDAGATPDVYLTEDQVADRLGKRYSAEEVLKLADDGVKFATQKEEYDIYRKETVDNALAMGVRAMGNDFPKETWDETFATMGKKQIEDITKTWEAQAKEELSAGRQTDPNSGVQDKPVDDYPDEAFEM